MSQRMLLAMLVPLMAIAVIVAFAGGLGIFFMIIEGIMHNEYGVIVVGIGLVVGVPGAAYLIERAIGEPQ